VQSQQLYLKLSVSVIYIKIKEYICIICTRFTLLYMVVQKVSPYTELSINRIKTANKAWFLSGIWVQRKSVLNILCAT